MGNKRGHMCPVLPAHSAQPLDGKKGRREEGMKGRGDEGKALLDHCCTSQNRNLGGGVWGGAEEETVFLRFPTVVEISGVLIVALPSLV